MREGLTLDVRIVHQMQPLYSALIGVLPGETPLLWGLFGRFEYSLSSLSR